MSRVLFGGLVLGVLYAVVQPYGATKAGQAGQVAQGLLQRVMSSAVAGIPNRAAYVQKGSAAPTTPAPPVTTSGPMLPSPSGPIIAV